MGGVCPGGMVKRNAKVGEKLKTIKSFSKLKADCSPDSDADDFGKTRRKCESTERRKPFSSDSKPSTPNRSKASTPPPTLSKPSTPTRTSKVCSAIANFVMIVKFNAISNRNNTTSYQRNQYNSYYMCIK